MTTFYRRLWVGGPVILAALLSNAASFESSAEASGKKRIRVKGSDRMWNLAAAWAEAYHKVKPQVFIDIDGNGPANSPHFSALAMNHADICLSARQ